jgi:hypothetical protein
MNCEPIPEETLIIMISGKAEFFPWQGASSFLKGAGLFRPALFKKSEQRSQGNKSAFP